MSARSIALLCCLLVATLPAIAADAVKYGAAPAWITPVKLPEKQPGRDEAPAKVLLRIYQLRFGAEGTEQYVESYVRAQTPQGLQALGNIALPWKPDSDTLTVHHCELLRDGRVIDLLADGQRFEVMRRENNLEYAALDGVLTAALQPAGMEVGDVLHLAFTLKRESSQIYAPEAVLAEFAQGPISRTEVRASWDRATSMHWRATQDAPGVRETRAGKNTEVTWTSDDLEPISQPNNVPSRFWRFPMLEFSGYDSWNEVSRTLAPLYEGATKLSADSALKAEARTIGDSTRNVDARLEAVLRLVQDRVRYVFLGMGDGNLKPAPADLTWQRRFGDCKGKTALLIVLLRELGIEAEPVLVATIGGDSIADRLPMMSVFNHVIVRAHAGGRTWWLDGAGSGSWRRADMALPNYQWGLPVTARGEGLLRMVAAPATEPQVEVTTRVDARAGIHTDAPFEVETRIRGPAGAMLYSQISQTSQSRREQLLRDYWKREYDFVDSKTVSAEYDEPTGAAVLRMKGSARMDWGGSKYATDGLRVGALVDYARAPGINVDAPFLVDHPIYNLTRQIIQLPPRGRFTLDGGNYDFDLAGTHYHRHSKLVDGVFEGEASSRSLAPEIAAKEARAAQKQLNDMWKDRLEIEVGDYTLTEADVTAVRQRTYTDEPTLLWRGNILMNRGDYDAAMVDFDSAIRANAKSAVALADRGLAWFWKRDFKKARSDFDAALALDARDPAALRGLGALLRAQRDYPGAIDKLTASLQVDPSDTFALTNRAHAYSLLDRPDAALADAAAAIKLRPSLVEMYDLRAWTYASLGEDTKALDELRAMFAANPDSINAYRSASHNYSRLGRYDEAVKAMDRVIASKPDIANYLKRADVRDPDDYAGRLADMDAAIKLDPKDRYIVMKRAQLQAESGDHRGAVEAFSNLIKDSTAPREQRGLRAMRGIEYLKTGDVMAGRNDLAASLVDEKEPDVYNNFCWMVANAGVELASALAACDKAVALSPDTPAYLDSRGFVLLKLGRYDESLAAYGAALALLPKLGASLYGRGLATNRRCGCQDGDADLRAAELASPGTVRLFKLAGLTP